MKDSSQENLTLNPDRCHISENDVLEAIRTVYDPDIPVNVYDLGLIYKVYVPKSGYGCVEIDMTLTSVNCPSAQILPQQVIDAVLKVSGVEDVALQLVWEPPWSIDMASEATQLLLNVPINPVFHSNDHSLEDDW
jgi:metal-sulfur cluster biosynthetic enzyme